MFSRKKGRGKRVLPPAADESPQRRQRTTEPPDPQVLQATQALENMSMVATSPVPGQFQSFPRPPGRPPGNAPNIHPGRGQYPSGPTPPAPDFGNFPYISPGQNPYQSRPPLAPQMYRSDPSILPDLLSVEELRTLWDAAGTNPQTDFRRIKRDLFQNRYDLTPEMLKEACWTEEEDAMLRDTDITPNSDPAYLEFVAALLKGLKETEPNARFFRLRSIATYRTRIAYLDNIRYGRQNMGNPPAGAPPPPMLQPGFPAPGTYTASSGSASRGPVGGSLWPAQHRGVPPPMPGAILNQQQQPGYTPSVGGSTFSFDEYECPDPQSYLDDESEDYFGPYESPGAFLGGSSSGGSDPGASPLPSPGGQSGGPLGRQEHGGDLAGGRRLLPLGEIPPVTRAEAEWAGKPDRNPSGHTRRSGLTNQMLEDIRVLRAQGVSLKDISRDRKYRHFEYNTINCALKATGWKPWTKEEDTALRSLQNHREYCSNWAKIRNEPIFRDRRIELELEARCGFHSHTRPDDDSKRSARYFEFTLEDDRYIMLALAQRFPTVKSMSEQRFRLVDYRSLQTHVKNIGAAWGTKEDTFLRAEVERFPPGTPVNWESIAVKYFPPRRVEVLKRRWEFNETGEVRDIEEMMLEGPY